MWSRGIEHRCCDQLLYSILLPVITRCRDLDSQLPVCQGIRETHAWWVLLQLERHNSSLNTTVATVFTSDTSIDGVSDFGSHNPRECQSSCCQVRKFVQEMEESCFHGQSHRRFCQDAIHQPCCRACLSAPVCICCVCKYPFSLYLSPLLFV